jgi:hypothetical protein
MTKKNYNQPQVQIIQILLESMILAGSPVVDLGGTPIPGGDPGSSI